MRPSLGTWLRFTEHNPRVHVPYQASFEEATVSEECFVSLMHFNLLPSVGTWLAYQAQIIDQCAQIMLHQLRQPNVELCERLDHRRSWMATAITAHSYKDTILMDEDQESAKAADDEVPNYLHNVCKSASCM